VTSAPVSAPEVKPLALITGFVVSTLNARRAAGETLPTASRPRTSNT
jgi:hypothetical protein